MITAQTPSINEKVSRFTSRFQYVIIAVVLMSICPLRTLAQDHEHAMTQQQLTLDQKRQQGAVLKMVRDATERFKDVREAESDDIRLRKRTRPGGHGTPLCELRPVRQWRC
jgi:hypothetical protein